MIDYVEMKPNHIDGLVKVEEVCFGSGFARKTFEKEIENKLAFYVVSQDGNEVLGYAGLWNMCGCADIMNVAVRPDARRQGVAEKMLGLLENYCRENGVLEINLEVRVGNIPARQLYKKLGYKEISTRKGYYDGKEDGVFMKKILEEVKD